MSFYTPVFTGGVFQNNEIIVPYENFRFESEREVLEADMEGTFQEFFPFPVIMTSVFEVSEDSKSTKGVQISFGETKVLCISGDLFDGVD